MFYEILKILLDHVWNSFTAGFMSPPYLWMGAWTSAGFLVYVLVELWRENIHGFNPGDLQTLIRFTLGGVVLCMVGWFPVLMVIIPVAVVLLMVGAVLAILLFSLWISDFLSRRTGPPRDGAFRQNTEYYS